MSAQPENSKIMEIYSAVKLLQGLLKEITFQWIPSQGMRWLIKKTTNIRQSVNHNINFHSSKIWIKHILKKKYQDSFINESKDKIWNILLKNKTIVPDLPRKHSVALIWLTTGHDCLASHLYTV